MTGTRTKSKASSNGGRSAGKKAGAGESARRTRQSAGAKAAKGDASRLDVEWAKVLEHEQAINAEYQGLLQQRQGLDAEIDRVQKLAHQLVGRKDMLMEMRDEKPPLPTVAEMMAERARQSGVPAASGEEPGEEPEES